MSLDVEMLREGGIRCETGGHGHGRHNQWLHATDLLEDPQSHRGVHNRQSTRYADDHERGLCGDAQGLIDPRTVIIDDWERASATKNLLTNQQTSSSRWLGNDGFPVDLEIGSVCLNHIHNFLILQFCCFLGKAASQLL